MLAIQILIAAFALFGIGRAVSQYKSGHVPRGWFAFWVCFWIATGAVALLPETASLAANVLGVGRGADLVIYISLVALFFLVFRMFVKIEEIERQITRLVRKLAVEDLDKPDVPKM